MRKRERERAREYARKLQFVGVYKSWVKQITRDLIVLFIEAWRV